MALLQVQAGTGQAFHLHGFKCVLKAEGILCFHFFFPLMALNRVGLGGVNNFVHMKPKRPP